MAEADWKDTLPDDLKTSPALKDVKDIPGLAKRFIDTQAMVGASLRPPSADAPPEARTEFITKLREKVPELVLLPEGDDEPAKMARDVAWQRLGRPKEAKEYAPPKDVEFSAPQLEELRKEALEEGLTKAQFEKRAGRLAAILASRAQADKELVTTLRRELGAAFDERTAAAAAAAAKLGFPEGVVSSLKSGTVDAATFKAFSEVAKGFGQAAHVANQGGGASGALTPTEAKAQRDELMSRREYFNPKPNEMGIHRNLVDKVRALNEVLGD